MAANKYIKELYPECMIMGYDRMEEITEATGERPVIYCRRRNLGSVLAQQRYRQGTGAMPFFIRLHIKIVNYFRVLRISSPPFLAFVRGFRTENSRRTIEQRKVLNKVLRADESCL